MKQVGNDKKTYLLLPDLMKEAKNKQNQLNKENMGHTANSTAVPEGTLKRPLSHYLQINSLKNTFKMKEDPLDISSPELSFKSSMVFNEEQFLNRQMKDLKESCGMQRKKKSVDMSRHGRSNEKKKEYVNKVLKEIKGNRKKKEQRLDPKDLISDSTVDPPLQKAQKTQPDSVAEVPKHQPHDQLEPVMSMVQQMITSQNIFFDPDKFQQYLKTLRQNQQFQKALKAFVYSYYLQNAL